MFFLGLSCLKLFHPTLVLSWTHLISSFLKYSMSCRGISHRKYHHMSQIGDSSWTNSICCQFNSIHISIQFAVAVIVRRGVDCIIDQHYSINNFLHSTHLDQTYELLTRFFISLTFYVFLSMIDISNVQNLSLSL